MRKISKLAALLPQDQQHVLRLCEKNHYDHVVTILAKPRSQGGLDLQTSRSALCRFASTFDPHSDNLAREVERLMPLIEATSADPTVFPDAIRTLLQQHIFSLLAAHKPFENVERPLRMLCKLAQQQMQKEQATGINGDVAAHPGSIPPESLPIPQIPTIPVKKSD